MEKKTKTDLKKAKKDEVVEIAVQQQEELSQKTSELEQMKLDFEKQMSEMKSMMLQLQNQKPAQTQPQGEKNYELVSYRLGKTTLKVDEHDHLTFSKRGSTELLSAGEIHTMLKNGRNKDRFIHGLYGFASPEDAKEFKVKPICQLTDEYIIDVFKKTPEEFKKEMDRITEKKTYTPLIHAFLYVSAKLYRDDKLNMSAKTMDTFSKYFGKNISNLYVIDESTGY